MPPPTYTYYSLFEKQQEILEIGEDLKTFQEFGILIDLEHAEPTIKFEVNEEDESMLNYILQIFSLPLFGVKTFFLEIIQHRGQQDLVQETSELLLSQFLCMNTISRMHK